jgi:acylphosphatase
VSRESRGSGERPEGRAPGPFQDGPGPEQARPGKEAVRRRVIVSGRVQGVWFRESCRDAAAGGGVNGWVRNLADGTVEVVVEGPEAAVDRMVEWCREGPPRARVDSVDVHAEPPVGESGFRVRL